MKKLFLSLLLFLMGITTGILITDYLFSNLYMTDNVEDTTTVLTSSSSIAMMIQTEAGADEYALYTDTSWPDSSEYIFNSNLSKCENGSTVSWDSSSNQVIMTGNSSDKCYIYFDIKNYTTLQERSYGQYGSEIWAYESNTTKIVFDDGGSNISDYDYVYDLSEKEDNSIQAYVVNNGDDTYTTYIISDCEIYANENMIQWFDGFTSLESIEGLDKINTSNTTDMSFLFLNCDSLTTLDLSSWDTSKVTTMEGMFSTDNTAGNSLISLNLSGSFNTSNVTTMARMFQCCSSLTTLDLSSWDVSKVTDMYGMFQVCTSLTSLDLSGWNTSNVTYMGYMFYFCESLTSLDLSGWDTSNVTTMERMFEYCDSLTSLDLSSFNTSKVTDMEWMFCGCSSLTKLDMSNADFSNVTSYDDIFMDVGFGNGYTTTIIVKDSDAYDFVTNNLVCREDECAYIVTIA